MASLACRFGAEFIFRTIWYSTETVGTLDPVSHRTYEQYCPVAVALDDDTRRYVWDLFKNGPAPVGYDPAIVPAWRDGPTSAAFAALRLVPWRLRVMPGTAMLSGTGAIVGWRA